MWDWVKIKLAGLNFMDIGGHKIYPISFNIFLMSIQSHILSKLQFTKQINVYR